MAAWFRRRGARVVLVPPERSADVRHYYAKHAKSNHWALRRHDLSSAGDWHRPTVLSAWTGPRGALTQVACNDDSGSLQSRIAFTAEAGVTYHLLIGTFPDFPAGHPGPARPGAAAAGDPGDHDRRDRLGQ